MLISSITARGNVEGKESSQIETSVGTHSFNINLRMITMMRNIMKLVQGQIDLLTFSSDFLY